MNRAVRAVWNGVGNSMSSSRAPLSRALRQPLSPTRLRRVRPLQPAASFAALNDRAWRWMAWGWQFAALSRRRWRSPQRN